MVEIDEALHDEGLEELERHLLRQTALVQLQLRSHHDDGATGVVDALAEEVLAEATLLALEHVGERLERAVAGARHRATTTAVVEESVDRLLQHALLVVDDDLGRTEVEKALQPVVAVDHAAVEIVQVARREAATIELHHRAQVRRDHGDRVENHAQRRVGGVEERRDDLEALEGASLALPLARGDGLAERLGLSLEVEGLQALLDRGRAHATVEPAAVAVAHLAVEDLVALEVLDLEGAEAIEDLVEALDLVVRAAAYRGHLALG